MSKNIVLGSFELVSLPQFNLNEVVAKIDTGAYSGAVHCTDIKVIRRGVIRKRILQFTPAGNPSLRTETDTFIKKYVRSSTGHRVARYLIPTEIFIAGKNYKIIIGISDRSDMKKQVLIGRRFLRENNMLVDVSLNTEYDDEGETTQ
jgi:hypothetical protein